MENHLCPKRRFSPGSLLLFFPLKFWSTWIFRSVGNSSINPVPDKKASKETFVFILELLCFSWVESNKKFNHAPLDYGLTQKILRSTSIINMRFWNIEQPIQNLVRYQFLAQVQQNIINNNQGSWSKGKSAKDHWKNYLCINFLSRCVSLSLWVWPGANVIGNTAFCAQLPRKKYWNGKHIFQAF